jgi:transcriptional regulator GlxA family with amidase domain
MPRRPARLQTDPPEVAVVAFDRISSFHLSVPCVVFGERFPGLPPFRLSVCAWEPGPLATTGGFEINVHHGLEAIARADTVIVPSWRDADEPVPAALCDALRAAHARGAQVVGLCLGAYALAEAGLLDGRRATTHWAYARHFAARYPQVEVHPEVLYVADGSLLTSAGTAAGLDCCLHIVRERNGAEAANTLARILVTPPHRQGGQAQFIEQPLPGTQRDSRLAGLLDRVRRTLEEPHTLDSLAEQALMSRRSFTRHFRQLTGTTVGQWLLAERLALVQRLLETTDHSVERIAQLAGLGSPESLRHHFRRALGVSPSTWRRTFRGA